MRPSPINLAIGIVLCIVGVEILLRKHNPFIGVVMILVGILNLAVGVI